MALTSVLLPDPETPVTQVKRPTGISAVTPLRLLPRALTTRTQVRAAPASSSASAGGTQTPVHGLRWVGTSLRSVSAR